MKESELLASLVLLLFTEEHLTAVVEALKHSLYKTTALEDSLIVPFHLQHSPILLYIDSSLLFLLTILFSFANIMD